VLLTAGAQILGADVDDAVGVDVEGHLNLRNAAAGRGDAVQLEHTQSFVVLGELPLALEHVHFHLRLVVGGGGENLALLGGDGGVAVNDLGHDAAHGLHAQGQGGDVQQQQALDLAAEHAALQGRAHGHAFVGVDALEGLLAHELLNGFLHRRDTGGTAHQQHLVDLPSGQAAVGQRLLDRAHGGVHQGSGQLVELRAGQGHIQMLRPGGVGGDERQVDAAGGGAGQLDFRLFRRLAQPLEGHLVSGEIHAGVGLEAGDHPVDNLLVEIVAAQTVVARRGQHLLHAVAHLDDGHVEGAAAQVVHHDLLVGFLIDAVGQGRGGGLVDDALDLHARDFARVLGGLPLCVGEIRGDGDNRLHHLVAQVRLGVLLKLGQNHRGNFLRGVILAVHRHFVSGAHFALDGRDGAIRVGNRLLLGHPADDALAVLLKGDDGRGGAGAFRVGNDDRLAALDNRHAGIRGA